MMKKFFIISILLICGLFCGCGGQKEKEVNYKFDTSENIFEVEENDELQTDVMGAYNIHYRDIDTEKGIVANGKKISIPVTVESLGYTTNMGIMAILDGKPVSFYTDEVKEDTNIKFYTIDKDKSVDITLNVEIQQGKKGDKVPLYIVGILEPCYIPKNEDDVSYGNYQKDLSLLPLTVDIQCDINERNIKIEQATKQAISTSVYEENEMEDGSNILDSCAQWKIEGNSENENKLVSKDGKVSFKLKGYGGDTANYSVICYINNEPVEIDGKENRLISLEKGKETILDYDIDISSYNRKNSMYLIIVPTAESYLNSNLSLVKTESKLLINDMQSEE